MDSLIIKVTTFFNPLTFFLYFVYTHALTFFIGILANIIIILFIMIFVNDIPFVQVLCNSIDFLISKMDLWLKYSVPEVTKPTKVQIFYTWLNHINQYIDGFVAYFTITVLFSYSVCFCLGIACGLSKLLLITLIPFSDLLPKGMELSGFFCFKRNQFNKPLFLDIS
jgi:hypothetical protein